MKKKENIALIFFSRNKVDEANNKSWFKEYSKDLKLASTLIDKAQNAVYNSGIPVFHFHEKNQKGRSFGEKIANAYQEVFDLGYEQVISVGNDCPDIENINWKEISINLSEGKSILGPDIRGGVYLIGLQKKSFDQERFKKLNWKKNTLYKELAQFCADSTLLIELKQYRDINSFHDIRLLSKINKSANAFSKLLSLLLKPFKTLVIEFQLIAHDFYIFKDSPLRAPPLK